MTTNNPLSIVRKAQHEEIEDIELADFDMQIKEEEESLTEICDNISKCRHLHELCQEMEQYEASSTNDDEYLSQLNIQKTVNQFLHLLGYHNENEQQFKFVSSAFDPCHGNIITKCLPFTRNYRDRKLDSDSTNIEELYNTMDYRHIVKIQMFDKIHSFYLHSYDTGNRLTVREQLQLSFCNDDEMKNNNSAEYIINKRTMKLRDILASKRKSFQNVYGLNERIKDRYNELDEINEDNMYVFGWDFQYDGEEKYDKSNDFVIIKKKYDTFKQELLADKLSIGQYNITSYKAKIKYESEWRKERYPLMSCDDILSLLIYCNFDKLQRKFSTTYRNKSGKSHSNYYHLGKHLKDTVSDYGTMIKDSNFDAFFHGIGERLIFPDIIGNKGIGIIIKCPLSTSSSFVAATNFTNVNNGLVIQFGAPRNENAARFFPMSWLSDFPHEAECFFIQNEYELQIDNMFDCKFGCYLERIIDALHIIDEIVTENYMDNKIINDLMESLILKIIGHQLSKNKLFCHLYKEFKSLHEYAKIMIDTYCKQKISLKINYSIIHQEYSFMYGYIYSESCLIKIHLLNALFINLQTLEIKNINLCKDALDGILQYLVKRNNEESKLTKIVIKSNPISDLSVDWTIKHYQNEFRNNNFTLYKGKRDNVLCILCSDSH